MKSWVFIGMLFLAVPSAAFAVDDPFSKSTGAEKRVERKILKLPKAVSHRMIDGSKHEYAISGIYSASAKNDVIEDIGLSYKILIPDSLEFALDLQASKVTFSTSRELSLSELAYAIDDMASLGGDIPFWIELEARDIEESKEFAGLRYTMKATTESAPPELAWFWVPMDRAFQVPLSIGASEHGSLLIVPSTAFCMCHSRWSLRVLDPKGKLIWKEEDTAFAAIRVALSKGDESGMHRIWLHRNDHGKVANFLISGEFTKKQQAEPVAPTDGDERGK